MSRPITGGAVFPSPYSLPEHQGLTLRQYYAAKAMQGWMANEFGRGSPNDHAKWAFEVADAMIKFEQDES